MLLSKLDFEEGKISRLEYLKRLSEMAKMEKRAKTILGYYADNFGGEEAEEEEGKKEEERLSGGEGFVANGLFSQYVFKV